NNRIRKVDTAGIITTVAGIGLPGYDGDGGPATQAQLGWPLGIALDAVGNLYIADSDNDCIRKVDTAGIITTVAGIGQDSGCSGDGGPATQARIAYPAAISVDTAGNLYISDGCDRIRKVDTSGIIATVAGIGTEAYSGDGGPPTLAELNHPHGVAVDAADNLYFVDTYNLRIRRVDFLSFMAGIFADKLVFTEENGIGHIMSSAGRHETTIDLYTGVTLYEFGYDQNNNLIAITDRFGEQIIINRDDGSVPYSITSPDGIITNLTIDANNQLAGITYPDSTYHSFEYTSDGLMTAKVEPEGNRFEHTFDSFGRLTDAADQEGGHWHYTRAAYDNGDILTEVLTAEGNRTSYLDHTYSTGAYTSTITDPTGAETLFAQSADGLTVNKSLPCGMELEFKYDADSEHKFKYIKEMRQSTPSALQKITLRDKTYQDTNLDDIPDLITKTVTVNGKTTTLENNTIQSQKTITSPEGRTVTTLYDPATLLAISVTLPDFFATTYGYDTKGRLTSIDTNTRGTDFTYNVQGFLETITDPKGYTTNYDHDAVGRVTGIGRPDGSYVGFMYDHNGNMIVLTNPSTIDHSFGHNKVNRNNSYQTPLSGRYSYLYDKDRRLIQTNFPSGNQINNVYDQTRLMQIQTPEGNINFTYLCGTKIESITSATNLIAYGYDGSLVTSKTLTGILNQSLGYTFNNDFDLQSFTYAGNTVNYIYDNDGLLTGTGSFTITRNAGNGLPEMVTGGALNLSRAFNGYGEVDGQTFTVNGQGINSWSLSRDDNGRITQKTETTGGVTSNYMYTYDPMGRLLTVTKDDALVEEYEYGQNGTRTYEMNTLKSIAGRTFDYSDEDHLLTAGATTYQYDEDGFLTVKTDGANVTTYDYSSRGELLGAIMPDGTMIEYIHDTLGRRIAKKVDGLITEKYLWQGLTRLLALYDGSDNLVMRFEYADGRMP
ncbi:MAG: hypothetical protein JRE27_09275, partial [Deltaproteobacteria bacterium]|nr:hypothetical protein [Deltaproteobacteria bacterium]